MAWYLIWYLNDILLIILFYHASFSFFLIIDSYFLIPAAITQIFCSNAELVMAIEIPSKKKKKSRNWITPSNCKN